MTQHVTFDKETLKRRIRNIFCVLWVGVLFELCLVIVLKTEGAFEAQEDEKDTLTRKLKLWWIAIALQVLNIPIAMYGVYRNNSHCIHLSFIGLLWVIILRVPSVLILSSPPCESDDTECDDDAKSTNVLFLVYGILSSVTSIIHLWGLRLYSKWNSSIIDFKKTLGMMDKLILAQCLFLSLQCLPIFILERYGLMVLYVLEAVVLTIGRTGVKKTRSRWLTFYLLWMTVLTCLDLFFAASPNDFLFGRVKSTGMYISWVAVTVCASLLCFTSLSFGVTLIHIGFGSTAIQPLLNRLPTHVSEKALSKGAPSSRFVFVNCKSENFKGVPLASQLGPEEGELNFTEEPKPFPPNIIRTAKYNPFTFLPKLFAAQFSRLANAYTLGCAILCFFPFAPVGPVSNLTPLLLVLTSAGVKEIIEDVKRHRSDRNTNGQACEILQRGDDPKFVPSRWEQVEVGSIVRVKEGGVFPADMVCLATSREDGESFVKTVNLDGETNLKMRTPPEETVWAKTEEQISGMQLVVECEPPNIDVYSFDGTLSILPHSAYLPPAKNDTGGPTVDLSSYCMRVPIGPNALMLRGTKLCTTDWIIGVVVYTGRDTKVEQNAVSTRHKSTDVEAGLNRMMAFTFLMQIMMCILCAVVNYLWIIGAVDEEGESFDKYSLWYLPDDVQKEDQPEEVGNIPNFVFLTSAILYNSMIPLSVYVFMEGVRLYHARFVDYDKTIYDKSQDFQAQAVNTNITEDLGQIEYVFTDKTGTLTRNEMVFQKCTVAGVLYGDSRPETIPENPDPACDESFFYDPTLLENVERDHETAAEIQDFLLMLALCNTVLPEKRDDESGGPKTYQAGSPDEEALVIAGRALGYELWSRDGANVTIRVNGKDVRFQVLNVLEFNSDRKRMSVIVRTPENTIRLLTKGADNVIFARLTDSQSPVKARTVEHLQHFASDGLRTLLFSHRTIPNDEYDEWNARFQEAAMSLVDRAQAIDEVAETIEKNLTLIGASAIEDRLQEGVPDTLVSLRKAGIKVFVLTGDKQETAISIGHSSGVLHDESEIVILNETSFQSVVQRFKKLLEKYSSTDGDIYVHEDDEERGEYDEMDDSSAPKRTRSVSHRKHDRAQKNKKLAWTQLAVLEESFKSIRRRTLRFVGGVTEDLMEEEGRPHKDSSAHKLGKKLAVVIDGPTLAFALKPELKYQFLALTDMCESIICCRCTPLQKGTVVRMVADKQMVGGDGALTLAIGDGANDVPMIQEAHVGVGIAGREGRQAVLCSDFAIGQFRFLKRLLFVHGHWSYYRMSKFILYTFCKSVALCFTNFGFSSFSLFSGQLMFFANFYTLYNAIFATMPIFAYGVLDQDAAAHVLESNPRMYRAGPEHRWFNLKLFWVWIASGTYQALLNWGLVFAALCLGGSVYESGVQIGMWGAGAASFTSLVITTNMQVALHTRRWTKWNALALVLSIVIFILFALFYNAPFMFWLDPDATNVIFVILSSPLFWILMILVPVCSLFPDYLYLIMTMEDRFKVHLMEKKQVHRPSEMKAFRSRDPSTASLGFAFSEETGRGELLMANVRRESVQIRERKRSRPSIVIQGI